MNWSMHEIPNGLMIGVGQPQVQIDSKEKCAHIWNMVTRPFSNIVFSFLCYFFGIESYALELDL